MFAPLSPSASSFPRPAVLAPAPDPPTRLQLVFFPDEARAGPPRESSPAMRWSEYLERCALPWFVENNASPATIEDYREIGLLFSALTGDPPLSAIGAEIFRDFKGQQRLLPARRPRRIEGETDADYYGQLIEPSRRPGEAGEAFAARRAWLEGQARISQNTRRKQCVTINRMLRLAGQPVHDVDESFGLLDRPPTMKVPELVLDDNVEVYTEAEYQLLAAACPGMDVPKERYTGLAPPLWWSCLLPFLRGTGVRIGTAMGARWEWLNGHWLRVPPAWMKRRRGRPVYLSTHVLAAIEPLRAHGRPTIFGWPAWPRGSSWLERCYHRLEDLAGLTADRHLGPHALRATHATMVWLRNGAVARQSLGHTRLETTIGHYIANTAMAETLESLF